MSELKNIEEEILENEESEVETAEESEEQRGNWEITDDQKAEWAMKKIQEAKVDRDRWVAFYKEQMNKAKEQYDENVANLKFMLQRYFAGRSIEGFTRTTRTQESYSLPSGKLVMKKQQAEHELDYNVLIPWLEKNAPQFVVVEKSVAWGELKKNVVDNGEVCVTEDGEIVPGIRVIPRDDKFTVEVK